MYPQITLTGEKCCLCKTDYDKKRERVAVTRFVLEERFKSSDADSIGLVVGIVFGEGCPQWFDVTIRKASPIRLLSLQLHPVDFHPQVSTRIGDFYHPSLFELSVGKTIQNKSTCLLGHISSLSCGEPLVFIFPRKKGLYSAVGGESSGWQLVTHEEFEIMSYLIMHLT